MIRLYGLEDSPIHPYGAEDSPARLGKLTNRVRKIPARRVSERPEMPSRTMTAADAARSLAQTTALFAVNGCRSQPACAASRVSRIVLGWLVLTLGLVGTAAAADRPPIQPRFVMDTDPQLTVPPVQRTLDPRTVELWRQALHRPEAEYQYRAADAVARAHRGGFPGMEAAKPDLLKIVQDGSARLLAVTAAVQALLALDARDCAEALFQRSQSAGADLRQLVEPALARWDFQPIRAVWHRRLEDPTTRRRDLLLAISGAAAVRDADALGYLLAIVRDPNRPADIRLAAARAAGSIADSGLEPLVVELMGAAGSAALPRLCAVGLLARHTSASARDQLLGLARDPEPSVAAPALQRLLALDPQLLLPLVNDAGKHSDAQVRLRAAEAYIALPTAERIASLAALLDDPHPDVRGRVREALFDHAQTSELRPAVEASAVRVLEQSSWRGQEQAALLLAALDYKPAAPRLVELLESERAEVMVASAWALRVLAVPSTVPALYDKAERQTLARATGSVTVDIQAVDRQVAHLFEALALLHDRDSIPLMKRYVPKSIMFGEYSRGAAIWGLGLLLQGQPDEPLARQLMERANDIAGMPPELELVRQMCAIALGRMKASSQLESIKKLLGPEVDPDPVEVALRWAIREIAGEELPPPKPRVISQGGWFLTSTRPENP